MGAPVTKSERRMRRVCAKPSALCTDPSCVRRAAAIRPLREKAKNGGDSMRDRLLPKECPCRVRTQIKRPDGGPPVPSETRRFGCSTLRCEKLGCGFGEPRIERLRRQVHALPQTVDEDAEHGQPAIVLLVCRHEIPGRVVGVDRFGPRKIFRPGQSRHADGARRRPGVR